MFLFIEAQPFFGTWDKISLMMFFQQQRLDFLRMISRISSIRLEEFYFFIIDHKLSENKQSVRQKMGFGT